jgi:predicted ATP-grasp superfamily ATP-dependent carboligase
MHNLTKKTPVLILGGQENTLAITRSLAKMGVPINVSANPDCWALRSRYCLGKYPRPKEQAIKDYWAELLLSGDGSPFQGHVVLTCSDDAIEFVALNRAELEKRYILERNIPEQQLALLDKQQTLEMARAIGVPTPNFWDIQSVEDIQRIDDSVQFPVIIKPIHSHVFQRYYIGKKYLLAQDLADLKVKLAEVLERGLRVMVSEIIPGPDALLNSYYTYIDEHDQSLFHFTKRIIRRFPVNSGGASYHITEWLPETAELGKQFFQGIKFRGLGNIEFKRDLRDGKLKVIECNARFTAAHELLVRCGMDTSVIVYCHLTGQPIPRIDSFKEHIRLLFLRQDIAAFRQLRGMGMLTFTDWLKSLAYKQNFPYLSPSDLQPFFAINKFILENKIGKLTKQWTS